MKPTLCDCTTTTSERRARRTNRLALPASIPACCAAALLLAACDPFSLLEPTKKTTQEEGPQAESTGWTLTGIPAANIYVLSAGGGAVTVTPLGVIIPVSSRIVQELGATVSNTFTDKQAAALAGEIASYVSNRLAGRTLSLLPQPRTGPGVQALSISIANGPNIAYDLVEKGYAAIAPDAPGYVQSACAQRQQSAYEQERGIWRPQQPLSNRLSATVTGWLGEVGRSGAVAAEAPAERFHSEDLFTTPSGSRTFNAEAAAVTSMKCGATVALALSGPPRAYTVTVSFEPRALLQDNSGPLSSFKESVLQPVETTVQITGGETTNIPIEYAAADLNRVLRADRIAVYTGTIYTGYDVVVSVDDTTVCTANGTFDQDSTLRTLD